jgi:cell wall-associated NlpC family hydrolase
VTPNLSSEISNPSAPQPFFSSDWIIQKLCSEAVGWVGTPFAPHSQVCGAGVDCIHLCAAIYEATGFLEGFRPPPYTIDAGQRNAESQILEWLQHNRQFQQVFNRGSASPDSLLPGDLLLFKLGMSEHHCGVLLGRKKFIHAPFAPPSKVAIDSLTDSVYRRCLTFAFRPLAVSPVSEGPTYKEVMG